MHTHTYTELWYTQSLTNHTLDIQQHLSAFYCMCAEQRVCVGHLGSVILSLSHFCMSAWLIEPEMKLMGPSLCGRGLLWARLWARSSFCLLGIGLTFPSSSSSSSSLWQGVGFRKGLSQRVMMSETASVSLSNHRCRTVASHSTSYTPEWSKQNKWPQHPKKERIGKREE